MIVFQNKTVSYNTRSLIQKIQPARFLIFEGEVKMKLQFLVPSAGIVEIAKH